MKYFLNFSLLLTRLISGLVLFAIVGMLSGTRAQETSPAKSMLAAYTRLEPGLKNNPYRSPVWLESTLDKGQIDGEIYGMLDHPFHVIRKNLQSPENWCEILFLHLNTKYCKPGDDNTIGIYVGRKNPQSLDAATRIQYRFESVASHSGYMKIAMTADEGPYGTSDYRIVMEGIPLNEKQSFIRVDYGYRYGTVAALAMKTYLATIGSDKKGLTIIGKRKDGSPEYISGLRGVIERNTLRYYLAVTSYLDSLSSPPEKQLEKRLSSWFDATEHYPQLHEISKAGYMAMKKEEYQRMLKGEKQTGLAK